MSCFSPALFLVLAIAEPLLAWRYGGGIGLGITSRKKRKTEREKARILNQDGLPVHMAGGPVPLRPASFFQERENYQSLVFMKFRHSEFGPVANEVQRVQNVTMHHNSELPTKIRLEPVLFWRENKKRRKREIFLPFYAHIGTVNLA